jgi:hypothetical protein
MINSYSFRLSVCGSGINIKHFILHFCLYSYCNFIDPPTPGDHQDAAPRNTDAMVLCISKTGVFLLQSAVDIFVVKYNFSLLTTVSLNFLCILRIRIRDPVPFGPRNPE